MNQAYRKQNSGPIFVPHGNLQARLRVLGDEFSFKVHYDFESMLFLGLEQFKEVPMDAILQDIRSLPGYKEHRWISFKDKICHLYIMFLSPAAASSARLYFISKGGFHAEIVDQILKSWYAYEMIQYKDPAERSYVYGILDIVYQSSYDLGDKLSEELATQLLNCFREFYIVEVKEDSVQIAFYSMAEGIAACIIYGMWYCNEKPKFYPNYYRIKLEKSKHFTKLLGVYNSPAVEDAFGLEYFVTSQATAVPQTSNVLSSGRSHAHNGTPRPRRDNRFGPREPIRTSDLSQINERYKTNPSIGFVNRNKRHPPR